MQIVGVVQSCRSGNKARLVLELILITNQIKKLIVLNISRYWKFQMIYFESRIKKWNQSIIGYFWKVILFKYG